MEILQKVKKIKKISKNLRKLYEGFCEKFYGQNFSLFHFSCVVHIRTRCLRNSNFKKIWGGAGPSGPSDATPMTVLVLVTHEESY